MKLKNKKRVLTILFSGVILILEGELMSKKSKLSEVVFEIFAKEQKESPDGQIDYVSFVDLCKKRIGNGISRNKIKSALISLEKYGVKRITENKRTFIILETKPTKLIEQDESKNAEQYMGIYYVYGKHDASIFVEENQKCYSIKPLEGVRNNASVNFIINKNNDIAILDYKNPPVISLGFLNKDKETGEIYFYEQSVYGVITKKYLVLNPKMTNNAFGHVVTAKINDANQCCTIDKVFGPLSSLKEYVRAHAHAVEADKPLTEEGEKQLNAIPTHVDPTKYNIVADLSETDKIDPTKPTYIDLRNKLFCTIDPFDCQDMDDAVYTEIDENGNIVTYAAIADVTEYIRPFSPIWNDAAEKNFTLYTLLGAFDMLPHKIASGICSLNPNEDRLTMCVKTTINPKTGDVISGEVVQAIINSKKKFSYNEAQQIFDDFTNENINENFAIALNESKKSHKSVEPSDLVEALVFNLKASQAVWKRLHKTQTLRLNSDEEVQFYLDPSKEKIEKIERKAHLPSMELIEALMINANEFTARKADSQNLPVLYRTHGISTVFKIEKFNSLISCLDCDMEWDGSNVSLQKILNHFKDSEYEEIVNEVAKTCLDKARYFPVPHPIDKDTQEVLEDLCCHNALGLDYYLHFTSGIRRFPDLINQYGHKCLWNKMLREKGLSSIVLDEIPKEYVYNMAQKVSAREVEIDKTSKTIEELALAIYAEEHVNEIFEGRIRSIIGDELVVVTKENMRVKISISDAVGSSKYTVTNNNVAVVLNNQIVAMVGEVVKFKISNANRFSRSIVGSTDLTKKFEMPKITVSDIVNAEHLAKCFEKFSQEVIGHPYANKRKQTRAENYQTNQKYKNKKSRYK